MRLPSRQKTILVLTFALGIFVTIVDVVRIYYLQKAIGEVPTGASTNPDSQFGGQENFAWNAALSLMWSAVEVNVGMTIACVPTLKPLILKLLPAMLYDPDGSGTSWSKPPTDSQTPTGRDANHLAYPDPVANPARQSNDTRTANEADFEANNNVNNNNNNQNDAFTAMEFLTTPGPGYEGEGASLGNRASRTATYRTQASALTQENAVYFGFVNMAKPKSMLRTNSRESLKYCGIVSVIFFLWGWSYGLLNTLNNVVAAVNGMTSAQTLGLTSAYFGGGYFFGPLLVGEWILRRDEHNRTKRHRENVAENVGGFKVTFIVGLCIYGTGTIIFWPSAVTNSFGGFMLSNFVVGFGLSVLEVGANAFMILCGPPLHGETRLLLAQGVQGVGSVISGLLAQKVFFTSIDSAGFTNSLTLINVQWTYLGITLLTVALGLFFFYMPLPEVSDSELQEMAEKLPIDPKKRSIAGLQLRTVSLILAVFAQYCYVAAQESNSIYFRNLLASLLPGADPGGRATESTAADGTSSTDTRTAISVSDYLLVAHTAFALSRFSAAALTYAAVSHPRLPRPRTILTFCLSMCFIMSLLIVVVHPTTADLMVIPVVLFFFFEGPVWPLIFTMGLRGQGRRTKRAAAFITMGGSGPAFFPFIMYGIIAEGGSVQTAYIVIIALQVAMMVYAMFLELSGDAKVLVAPYKEIVPTSGAGHDTTDDDVVRRHNDTTTQEEAGMLHKLSSGFRSKKKSPPRQSPILEERRSGIPDTETKAPDA
jgi:fucose permease